MWRWPAAARRPARDLAVSGRVDRLVIEKHRVLVVDYKTNPFATDRIEDADPASLMRWRSCGWFAAPSFPDRKIEAARCGPMLSWDAHP